MALPMGEVRQFQVLYNSGAEINFIQYNLAKEYKLVLLLKWRKCYAVRYLVPTSTGNWARYIDRIKL